MKPRLISSTALLFSGAVFGRFLLLETNVHF